MAGPPISICSIASVSCTPLRHGLFERIQVHDHHVDRLDAVLFHICAMFCLVVDAKEPAVNFRVERLDASVQDLGKAGDLRDRAQLRCRVPGAGRRAAGGNDLHVHGTQSTGEVDESPLVRHTDQARRICGTAAPGE